MVNGRWVENGSPEALQNQQQQANEAKTNAAAMNKSLIGLSDAQAEDEANAMEQADNKEASNKAFAFATSMANARRPVGGGIKRGVGGNTINSATGGLVAANAAARRESMRKLGRAKIQAAPSVAASQGALARIQALTSRV